MPARPAVQSNIEVIDELPPVRKANSAGVWDEDVLQAIQDGKPRRIPTDEDKLNALGQQIRSTAQRLGARIASRTIRDGDDLYFGFQVLDTAGAKTKKSGPRLPSAAKRKVPAKKK